MELTIETIRPYFPSYRLNDASNRTNDELIKIATICEKNPCVIVFVRRTPTNQSYFTAVEVVEHMQLNSIKAIFINGDNYYFYKGANKIGFLHHMRRRIKKEIDCPICFEECDNVYFYCSQCGNNSCIECFMKMDIEICPMCRGDKFTFFNRH